MDVDTGKLRPLQEGDELLPNEVLVQGKPELIERLQQNVQAGNQSELAQKVKALWAEHEERMRQQAVAERARASGIVLP